MIDFTPDKIPDICPICKKGINAEEITRCQGVGTADWDSVHVIYKCPISKCQHYFIAYYLRYTQNRLMGTKIYGNSKWYLSKLEPSVFIGEEFPEVISNVSPTYPRIYNQAKQAEEEGLLEICGAGYRRALEFLVKDFIIHNINLSKSVNKEAEVSEVKKKFLKNCIVDHIDDKTIKGLATRAVYLGNDETHYVRIWEDKDLQDMKRLTKLTEAFINLHLLKDKELKGMKIKE